LAIYGKDSSYTVSGGETLDYCFILERTLFSIDQKLYPNFNRFGLIKVLDEEIKRKKTEKLVSIKNWLLSIENAYKTNEPVLNKVFAFIPSYGTALLDEKDYVYMEIPNIIYDYLSGNFKRIAALPPYEFIIRSTTNR
jgi:hypothetical protein